VKIGSRLMAANFVEGTIGKIGGTGQDYLCHTSKRGHNLPQSVVLRLRDGPQYSLCPDNRKISLRAYILIRRELCADLIDNFVKALVLQLVRAACPVDHQLAVKAEVDRDIMRFQHRVMVQQMIETLDKLFAVPHQG
jgi:hypothetical protein